MTRPDLDALETRFAGLAYEPLGRDETLALIALARRAEQAEAERDDALARAQGSDLGYEAMKAELAAAVAERDAARAALSTVGCPSNDCIIHGKCARPTACTSTRPPLSAEHREVLRGMLEQCRTDRAYAVTAFGRADNQTAERIAALQAVLGEEQEK